MMAELPGTPPEVTPRESSVPRAPLANNLAYGSICLEDFKVDWHVPRKCPHPMVTPELLEEMMQCLAAEDADEMAIPSYLHPLAPMRWMAWRRIHVVERSIERIARDFTSPKDERRALDFGCGTGVLFDSLVRQFGTVYGVDTVLEPAKLLKERLKLDDVVLQSPDLLEEAIEDASLDLIVCAEVLEHVNLLGDTLDLLRRKLAPTGRMIVTLPTENLLYRLGRRLAGFSGHYHLENATSVHHTISQRGLNRIRSKSIPLPGPCAIYRYGEYVREDALFRGVDA